MADGDRPHFVIRPELVHGDLVTKTGFGESYVRPDFGEHGRTLVRRTQEFRQATAAARDSGLSSAYFLQVSTPEGVPIRQEKTRLRSVGLDVIAYSRTDPHSGTAKVEKQVLDDIEARLINYATRDSHPGRSYFSVIEDIGEVPVEEKLDPALQDIAADNEVECIVYVQASLSEREQQGILDQIGQFASESEGDTLQTHRFSSGLATALVKIRASALRELGRTFNTVRELRPNRAFFVEDSTPIGPLPNPVLVAPPAVPTAVVVVDSGIQGRCQVLAPVISHVLPALPPHAVEPHYEHGTFVGSRVAYGDDLEVQLAARVLRPICRLIDLPVFGRTAGGGFAAADEHHLAVALDTLLPGLPPEARVVNLSLGTDQPIRDNEYSLVASTLDHLAREHDLLVVTTAGNVRDRNLVSGYPASAADPRCRVDPPGEALLALTVGSFAHYGDATTLSASRELSPFSRVGPGADGGRKPEVVAHGGNYVRPALQVSRYAVQGIFGDGQQIAWDNGTSFSAPLVAARAAVLFHAYPDADANLVKALLCHFTQPVAGPASVADACACVGFGEPDVRRALGATGNAASFLFSGDIGNDRYVFVPFLVPAALAPGGAARLRIRCTLIFNPPTDPANPPEYSKSRISLNLRKPADVGHGDVQVSSHMLSYKPWNPVIHFDKRFSHSYQPGSWEVRLRLWTRDLQDNFRQRFAIVIEVCDDSGTVDVWQRVRDEAGTDYTPVVLNTAAA